MNETRTLIEDVRFLHRAAPGWFTYSAQECRICHTSWPCNPYRLADAVGTMLLQLHALDDEADANPDQHPLGEPTPRPLGAWPLIPEYRAEA